MESFLKNKGLEITVEQVNTPMFSEGVSGTQMRRLIADGNIKEFQTYEKPEDLSVSMSGEDIQGINSLQSGLKDLIHKFTNKPKIVA